VTTWLLPLAGAGTGGKIAVTAASFHPVYIAFGPRCTLQILVAKRPGPQGIARRGGCRASPRAEAGAAQWFL